MLCSVKQLHDQVIKFLQIFPHSFGFYLRLSKETVHFLFTIPCTVVRFGSDMMKQGGKSMYVWKKRDFKVPKLKFDLMFFENKILWNLTDFLLIS